MGKQEVADLAVWPDSVPSVPIYKRTLELYQIQLTKQCE